MAELEGTTAEHQEEELLTDPGEEPAAYCHLVPTEDPNWLFLLAAPPADDHADDAPAWGREELQLQDPTELVS